MMAFAPPLHLRIGFDYRLLGLDFSFLWDWEATYQHLLARISRVTQVGTRKMRSCCGVVHAHPQWTGLSWNTQAR